MKNFLNAKTFIILAVVAIGAAYFYADYAGKKADEGVEIMTHIKGNPDARVILTEHSDFQCPACGQFYPVVKDLVEQYDGQLALEYKHFPLISIHPLAVPAAKAAEAAGQQGKFFEMHDLLFENQESWGRSRNPRPFFSQYAEELDLDMGQFNRQYGSAKIENHIEAQFNEARELGLTGTPSFFLNGERLEFETFEDFTNAIDTAVNGSSQEAEEAPAENSAGANVNFGI